MNLPPTPELVAHQDRYHEVCRALLTRNDYARIGGEDRKTKSAWRKLAQAFNVSDRIIERIKDFDAEGRTVRAEFVVRATAPNGREAEGVGIASKFEGRGWSNPEHDIPATAHTRAKNRAFADLFGLGEVSAEEITEEASKGSRGSGSSAKTGRNRSEAQRARREREATEAAPRSLDPIAELEFRLNALAPASRAAFREWLRTEGLEWPPPNEEGLPRMVAEVAALEAVEREEAEAYDDKPPPPVSHYEPGAGSGLD
jgi:hypothetical protein